MLKPKLLSDEELSEILQIGKVFSIVTPADRRLAQAQCDDTFRKTVEQFMSWGNEPCPHALPNRPKRFCEFCWYALKSQLKEA